MEPAWLARGRTVVARVLAFAQSLPGPSAARRDLARIVAAVRERARGRLGAAAALGQERFLEELARELDGAVERLRSRVQRFLDDLERATIEDVRRWWGDPQVTQERVTQARDEARAVRDELDALREMLRPELERTASEVERAQRRAREAESARAFERSEAERQQASFPWWILLLLTER